MGSMECDKRELDIDDPKSNWEWPNLPLEPSDVKKLMGRALEISVKFFFSHFTYTFGGELYIQMFGGPIGARLTMCLARIVLQEWREEFSKIINKSELEELLSKIYVDDSRSITKIVKPGLRFDDEKREFIYDEKWVREDEEITDKDRTMREIIKAMNSVNKDLRFTMEHESEFPNSRLPTLAFEIWSTKEGVRHSYYEKPMRNQVLTMKRSSMSENSKNSILTNELNRRFLMMDDKIELEEKIEKVNQFCQQLINSGYNWGQIREIVVSSLRSAVKVEKQIESGENRYRTGEESLIVRLRKKLLDSTEWYKKLGDRERERMKRK